MIPRPTTLYLILYLYFGPPTLITESQIIPQEQTSHHLNFRWEASGKTMKKGALEVSFSRYKSENGIIVERFVENYRTFEAARAEFEKLCMGASRIKQEGYKEDAAGKRIGRRAELFFARSHAAPEHTIVAWTDGSKLFSLRSESRSVLLDFEQQDYPAAPVRSIPSKGGQPTN